MDAVKPLIFVHPLSDTLKKLKEASEKNAEADGVEIYEIDDMSEFNQLFPTVGQSVCVFSDPKKCAKGLQANKKTISKIHSKVMLVSPKKIPPKTLEKFDKVGLTECIIEPVVPKTLMYKVKLHLRSIKASEPEDEEKTFNSKDDKEKDEEDLYHSKKSKKEVELDIEGKDKSDSDDEQATQEEHDIYQTKKEESHWKGKVQSDEDLYGKKEKKESGYKEEALDTHYKGKTKKEVSLEFEEEAKEKKEKDEEGYDIDEVKKSLELEIESDQSKEKILNDESPPEDEEREKDRQLEIEQEERKRKSAHQEESIESYMKGDLDSQKNPSKEESSRHDSSPDHLDKDHMKGESKADVLEEDIDKTRSQHHDSLEQEEDRKNESGVDKIDDQMKHDTQYKEEQGDHLRDDQERKSKNIEKYIKGHLSHREDEESDELIDNEKKLNLNEEKEDDPLIGKEGHFEDEKEKRKKDQTLDLEKSNDRKDQEGDHKDEDLDFQKKSTPTVQDTEAADEKKKNAESSETADHDLAHGHKKEDQKDREGYNPADDQDSKNSKERTAYDSSNPAKEAQRADNRADKIEKYYKGKGNKHQDQEWGDFSSQTDQEYIDNEKRKDNEQMYGSEAKAKQAPTYSRDDEATKQENDYTIDNEDLRKGGELHYQNEELGEQTIDYGKLKEEFEAIPYQLKDQDQSDSAYDLHEGSNALAKERAELDAGELADIQLYQREQKTELDEDLKTEESDDDDEDIVFEVQSKNLEDVIHISKLYEDKNAQIINIFEFISQTFLEKYKALVSFYVFEKRGEHLKNLYNSVKIKGDEKDQESWQRLEEIKLPFWQQMKLPAWSDHTFQDKELDFFYPYFEDGQFMGFAVVYFRQGVDPTHTGALEVVLESARGHYSHETLKVDSDVHENSILNKDKKKGEEKLGLLSKIFGKKAS